MCIKRVRTFQFVKILVNMHHTTFNIAYMKSEVTMGLMVFEIKVKIVLVRNSNSEIKVTRKCL